MKKIIGITVLSLLLLLQSCNVLPNTTEHRSPKLADVRGTQWQLADATNSKKIPVVMIGADGKIFGNAGCNTFHGDINLKENNRVSVRKVSSTRMACEYIDTEIIFLQMLQKVNNYKATEAVLELYQDELLLLKFNRVR